MDDLKGLHPSDDVVDPDYIWLYEYHSRQIGNAEERELYGLLQQLYLSQLSRSRCDDL